MSNDVETLAKALAELNIDETVPLTRRVARLNIESDLYWNDSERTNNCVWVSTARFFNCTVSELEERVGMKAPQGGANETQIRNFILRVVKRDLGMNGKPGLVLIGRGPFKPLGTNVVCYQRENGTRHCVLQENEKFICYQFNDFGEDVTSEIMAPGTEILLSWTFFRPPHAGAGTPILS